MERYGTEACILRAVASLVRQPNAGDIAIFGAYDGYAIISFDDQVGAHGSAGGDQVWPFLVTPPQVDVSDERIEDAKDIHRVVMLRWAEQDSGLRTADARTATETVSTRRGTSSNPHIRSPQSAIIVRRHVSAHPLDDELVSLPSELLLLGDEHRHPLEALVAELDDAATLRADQVLVVRLVAGRLEPPEALAEVALDDQARPHHDVERPVDRRGADRRASRPQLLLDVVGGDVALAAQHDLGDRLPLRGDGQIVIAKIGEKSLYGRGAVHGSGTNA